MIKGRWETTFGNENAARVGRATKEFSENPFLPSKFNRRPTTLESHIS